MEKILFFPPSFPSSSLSISLSVLLFVMDGYSLFCGLLTRVETKFLICHTCLCSILEHPGTTGDELITNTNTDTKKKQAQTQQKQ